MFSTDLIKEFQNLKTPFFYYDLNTLNKTIGAIREHGLSRGYSVHFALKANNNDRILKMMLDAGFGADCVSGGEIEKAIEIGFLPDQIAFAGVGKSDEEIQTGLNYNLFSFNCESSQELEVLNQFAADLNQTAKIALRVNPDVEAKTHKYITTGLQDNKFGILSEDLPDVLDKMEAFYHLQLTGLHFHIGSQITNLDVFRELCEKINALQPLFDEKGIELRHINVGGGLGIDYEEPDRSAIPDFKSYFQLFDKHLELRKGQELHFELGRSVVGQCGSLITRVLFTKEGRNTNFAIVDAGMTELIRPALYQARHKVDALTSTKPEKTYDVAGPICETSDTFRTGIQLPEVERGDLLAIRSAGAYGQVMSSDFNLRKRAKAYYTDDFDLAAKTQGA
ncbi:MAG: diaminopimelate decarboxylase [Balneolaceae bacterium]